MYSKNKGITDRDMILTPPPGYDGSRFRRRSDGRDDTFPLYSENNFRKAEEESTPRDRGHKKPSHCPKTLPKEEICEDIGEQCCECTDECCNDSCNDGCNEEKKSSPLSSLITKLGNEEILLISLLVLLSREENIGMDTLLILALLLCI